MANQPKKYQKFVATAATATLVAAAIVPVAAAAGFNDTSNYDKETLAELDRAVELGFVKGFENGDFKPADYVTRGQVAKILARHIVAQEGYETDLNGLKEYVGDFEITDGFSDVSEKRDSELYFASLIVKDAEVFTGNEKNQLLPEKNITRQQMAKVLVNAFDLEGTDEEVEISDLDKATKEFQEYIVILAQNGVTKANPYKPGEAVKRIQMASFTVRSYDVSPAAELVEIAALEVKNATTLAVSVTEANKELTAENFKVQVDGKEVEVKAAASNGDGSIYTLTIASLDGKKGEVAVNGVKKAYDFTATVVESIKAINASELQVNFSQAVDVDSAITTGNYDIKINNVKIADTDIADIAVSKDGKVATILLDQTKVAFKNGDKYVVQTNDAILSKEGKKIEKFVAAEATFSETAAPALVSTTYKQDELTFTFDRPVDAKTDLGLVKVDGISITDATVKPKLSVATGLQLGNDTKTLGKAGQYRYTVKIDNAEAKAQAKKLGDHEVVIFDVNDTEASTYPSTASVLTGSYKVTDQVTAPEVTGIEAVNANRIFVHTNTSVDLTNANVQVNKGAHTFTKGAAADISTANTTGTKSYAEAGFKDGKPGIWVVVTDALQNEANPLYRANETSVDLTVTVEKYTADGLVGKKSTQNVTVNKNNSKPTVATTAINTNNELTVTFTDLLEAKTLNQGADYVVRTKDGIIVTDFATATVDDKEIKFVGTAKTDDAPYTVEFKEGKFKNAESIFANQPGNTNATVATYIVNTVNNAAFTVSVGKEAESNFKYTEFKLDTLVGSDAAVQTKGQYFIGDNAITFKYPAKMSDSARDVANYTLDGKALPAGTTVDFLNDRETVKIVFPKNTFATTTDYKLGITTNVKTEAGSIIVGSLQTKAPVELTFNVKDNIAPELASAVYYVGTDKVESTTKTNQIELTFTEAVHDVATVDNYVVEIAGSIYKVKTAELVDAKAIGTVPSASDKVKLTLEEDINVSQAATISIAKETATNTINIKDIAGNKAKEGSSVVLEAGKTKFSSALQTQQIQQAELNTEAAKVVTNKVLPQGSTVDAATLQGPNGYGIDATKATITTVTPTANTDEYVVEVTHATNANLKTTKTVVITVTP